jgi:hypothetical protein
MVLVVAMKIGEHQKNQECGGVDNCGGRKSRANG